MTSSEGDGLHGVDAAANTPRFVVDEVVGNAADSGDRCDGKGVEEESGP
ncbi:hypothetical protein [Glycomyces tritici]|uniref:Uncharacterized protein n=1 Tax=Glycomyces tritici TaxID=2665176 RepID=A0ABT7YX03_9ACTN|nr:hypothetical protein [Glycomyces tritici]MDN3243122.1 hypothetical protein [Glycomyces tritici]